MIKNQFFLAALFFVFMVVNPDQDMQGPRPEEPEAVTAVPANLSIYWIDTEGGAATLIVTPSGESVLIDTGNPGGRDSDRIYEVAHHVAGLKQIDHLVITHWHIDHYGGAALLSAKMPVIEVMDKGIPDSLPEDKKFSVNIQPYRSMAVRQHTLIRPGGSIKLKALPGGFQKLALQFVGADKTFMPVAKASQRTNACDSALDQAADNSDNANSMVMMMDYGPFRFFDGGDLTWNIEKALVCPRNLVRPVDVYQVNHHGLDRSNNPVLINALAPTVSIMGNGPQKGCGPETIATLRSTPSVKAQYQLHKNIRPDSAFNTGEAFIANTDEHCNANYIKLTVTPNGRKYTVSIPAFHNEREFDTKAIH